MGRKKIAKATEEILGMLENSPYCEDDHLRGPTRALRKAFGSPEARQSKAWDRALKKEHKRKNLRDFHERLDRTVIDLAETRQELSFAKARAEAAEAELAETCQLLEGERAQSEQSAQAYFELEKKVHPLEKALQRERAEVIRLDGALECATSTSLLGEVNKSLRDQIERLQSDLIASQEQGKRDAEARVDLVAKLSLVKDQRNGLQSKIDRINEILGHGLPF